VLRHRLLRRAPRGGAAGSALTPELLLALVALVNAVASGTAVVINALAHAQRPRTETHTVEGSPVASFPGGRRASDQVPLNHAEQGPTQLGRNTGVERIADRRG